MPSKKTCATGLALPPSATNRPIKFFTPECRTSNQDGAILPPPISTVKSQRPSNGFSCALIDVCTNKIERTTIK